MVIIYLFWLDNYLAQIHWFVLILDPTQAIDGHFHVRDDVSPYTIDKQQDTDVRMISATTSHNTSHSALLKANKFFNN